MTTAGDSLEYFFHSLSEKTRLDISCESSARNIKPYFRNYFRNQALFSLKDESKKKKKKKKKKLKVSCAAIFVWPFKG